MENQKSASGHRLILPLFLTLLIPGLGHLVYGFAREGFSILIAGLLTTIGLSHFAVLGPWAMGIGAGINVLFRVGVLIWIFLLTKKQEPRPFKSWAVAVFALLVLGHIMFPDLQRVRVFRLASNSMEPVLVAGDHIAIDRAKIPPEDLATGEIVVVQIPNRPGEYIRRIQANEGDSVIVETNSSHVPVELIPSASVVGRVLYLAYSFDSAQATVRWDRLLKPIVTAD